MEALFPRQIPYHYISWTYIILGKSLCVSNDDKPVTSVATTVWGGKKNKAAFKFLFNKANNFCCVIFPRWTDTQPWDSWATAPTGACWWARVTSLGSWWPSKGTVCDTAEFEAVIFLFLIFRKRSSVDPVLVWLMGNAILEKHCQKGGLLIPTYIASVVWFVQLRRYIKK